MSCLTNSRRLDVDSFAEACEKQMCTLTSDNDKLKQYYHESERTMAQLKRDNEELQQKVGVVLPPLDCSINGAPLTFSSPLENQ